MRFYRISFTTIEVGEIFVRADGVVEAAEKADAYCFHENLDDSILVQSITMLGEETEVDLCHM